MVLSQTRALRRSAFTLVELLVVISIIGVLMALLLPAVNAARAAAWKMECSNNLTQLMKATQNWTAAKQMRLPGYTEPVGGKRLTWPIALMPYMEQQQLYDQFRSATQAQAIAASGLTGQYVPSFVCAADGQKGGETGAQMSYVANTGMFVPDRTAYTVRQSKANGVFQNSMANPLTTPPMPKVTLDVSDVPDEAQSTVAFSENLQAVTYGLPSDYNASSLAHEEFLRLAAGFQWYPAEAPIRRINGGNFKTLITSPDMATADLAQDYARPSSFHAGGVNMAFLDGHVQFIPQTVDYAVYQQLMTPDSSQSDMPVKTIVVPWDTL